MSDTLLPTKELLDMIEERIPHGRVLTTSALLLALLAVIVASCVYLYHALILPTINLVVTAVTTGKINLPMLRSLIGSLIGSALVFYILEWTNRGVSRLMREMLDYSKTVLKHNEEILNGNGKILFTCSTDERANGGRSARGRGLRCEGINPRKQASVKSHLARIATGTCSQGIFTKLQGA